MDPDYLEFEQPIAELEAKINELRLIGSDVDINISQEIRNLTDKSTKLTEKIYSRLSPWQISQVARHPRRPYTLDYIKHIFFEFEELHGDRLFADDQALIGGLGRLEDKPVIIIGHQKGRGTNQKIRHNFGMPRPEGYRKARRLIKLAERYKIPVLVFIDTPGAYPGMDAEERGINEAIAGNLALMSSAKTPLIAVVTGEANSGGAIAIGIADHISMLQYSTYTVITPEGCATILWKSSDYANVAAEAMGVTSERLESLGIIDQTISEPLGGGHSVKNATAKSIKSVLIDQVERLSALNIDELVDRRYGRLMKYGLTV